MPVSEVGHWRSAGLAVVSSREFYSRATWDEAAWVDVISIEYERLAQTYPFGPLLVQLAGERPARLLDVGCGTGIFPAHLSKVLAPDLHLVCDLLDISDTSLQRASSVMERLPQFEVGDTFQCAIEDIPQAIPASHPPYQLIWAIHSFTTVDRRHMPEVYRRLIDLLTPAGLFLVYQLAADSTYQRLHNAYRRQYPRAARYMEFEDSVEILDSLGVQYEVHPFLFEHQLPRDRPDLLQNYLRKCVLDDTLDALDFFAELLPAYLQDGIYRFPQTVNLLAIGRVT